MRLFLQSSPGRGGGPRGARWRGLSTRHSPPSTSLRLVPLPVPGRSFEVSA
jgi:hypothetical protein